MRKTKELQIEIEDNKVLKVVVKELTYRQLLNLTESFEIMKVLGDLKTLPGEIKKFLQDTLIPICTNLTYDQVLDFPPSDVDLIISAIREVNASFFEKVVQLDPITWIKQILRQYQTRIVSTLAVNAGSSVVSSLQQDTLKPSTMDTPMDSPPIST
jgi:hypothetical protein